MDFFNHVEEVYNIVSILERREILKSQVRNNINSLSKRSTLSKNNIIRNIYKKNYHKLENNIYNFKQAEYDCKIEIRKFNKFFYYTDNSLYGIVNKRKNIIQDNYCIKETEKYICKVCGTYECMYSHNAYIELSNTKCSKGHNLFKPFNSNKQMSYCIECNKFVNINTLERIYFFEIPNFKQTYEEKYAFFINQNNTLEPHNIEFNTNYLNLYNILIKLQKDFSTPEIIIKIYKNICKEEYKYYDKNILLNNIASSYILFYEIIKYADNFTNIDIETQKNNYTNLILKNKYAQHYIYNYKMMHNYLNLKTLSLYANGGLLPLFLKIQLDIDI